MIRSLNTKTGILVTLLSLSCLGSAPQMPIRPQSNSWVSSGGELFATGRNPWFVRNTSEVKYCITMDEPAFSITRSQVEGLIASATEFWQTEFRQNRALISSAIGYADIATQTFLLTACDAGVDLQFKFGANTLDADERDKGGLSEPRRFIGVTIRKSYDPVLLKGQGIIYISADKGSTAYLNSGQLEDQAWSSPELLKYALIHELGHVFGIPHVGAGLMSEVFMDTLLNKSMAAQYVREPQQSFLNPPRDFNVCRMTGKFNPDFFQVAKDTPCLLFRQLSGSATTWRVYSADELMQNPVEVGTAQAVSLETSPYALKPAVTVQLPHEQLDLPLDKRVFKPSETVMGPFLVGAIFSQQSYRGVFRPTGGGRPVTFNMSLSAEQVTFIGTLNNLQMTTLNYAPISFMHSLIP